MPTLSTTSLTRVSLQLIAPLVGSVAIVALLFAGFQVRDQNRALNRDLDRRSEVLAASLQESIEGDLAKHADSALRRMMTRLTQRDHIAGIAVVDADGQPLAMSSGLDSGVRGRMERLATHCTSDAGCHERFKTSDAHLALYSLPVAVHGQPSGALVVLTDATYIAEATFRLWRATLLHAALETLLIGLFALVLINWTFRVSIGRIVTWMRSLRVGGTTGLVPPSGSGLLAPLRREAAQLAESLDAARFAAVEEARLREAAASTWTAERLRASVQANVKNATVFVIANREPYMHVRGPTGVQVIVPASGVVTALEPVLAACDGTWIASGSGNADREFVDANDQLRAPPDDPHYTLRRVWLTEAEEVGYYLGFSNEGLWPLCHIAHTRPVFRPEDWEQYQRVNRKFAAVALEEMAAIEAPMVLVQDYHFALLPQLIKEQRPDARVCIFWHIPWPTAETFRICPWQRDLLKGLLGADLIGFHVQAHCNNFLESVDRALEARTDWDRFAVNRRGHRTLVRPFPISTTFVEPKPEADLPTERATLRKKVLSDAGLDVRHVGIGVDRIDYTKGIPERFTAIERFLDEHPDYVGEFSFVQLGAPSRTDIAQYGDILRQVRDQAQRINTKFRAAKAKPIVFLEGHHNREEIMRWYRAADICMVTSLHDGMNLVAKEFIAARDDDRGVLILSAFAGASRELPDALVVNPYDVAQVAAAIKTAIEMPADEQERRMVRMRHVVRERNIYRWAANLMAALAEIRTEQPERVET